MRVLVVEDEPLLAMLLEESLAELGYELAGSAATVPQALSMIDQAEVDCALLDFSLGRDSTSLPVANRLRDDGKPFYFLTGHLSLEGAPGLPQDAPMLTKPVSLGQLETALREMAGA
jgi:CheY-like chemotaxis protein